MIPLTKLKKDVQFTQELTKIIDVLKGIAAARFHVLERQLVVFERCFQAAAEFMDLIDVSRVRHPFVQAQVPAVGVVMVTSDAGFLGGLNMQVVNAGLQEAGATGVLTVIGERGGNYLRDLRHSHTSAYLCYG